MATRQLTITARPRDGFRRCGRRWPAEATTVDAGGFTKGQIDALKAEPNLVVQDSGDGQAAGGGQGNQGKGGQGQQNQGSGNQDSG